jgi:hypothetical protein
MIVSNILYEEVMAEIRPRTGVVKQLATYIRAQYPPVTPGPLVVLDQQSSRGSMNVGRPLAPRTNDATSMGFFDSILASMGSLGKRKRTKLVGKVRRNHEKTSLDVRRRIPGRIICSRRSKRIKQLLWV